MRCYRNRINLPRVVTSVTASQPCYGSGLRKHINETKHNRSANALIRWWRTLKRGTA
jgi:hypothetical protein